MGWTYDPSSTQIIWQTTHLDIMTVRGGFRGIKVTADMEGEDVSRWSVQVEIDASSLDSWAERRDGALKKADYLNVERFPAIGFESTAVARKPDGDLLVTGILSLIGVSREITLEAHLNGDVVDPRGLARRGFGARTSIRWSDFAPPAETASAWTNAIFRDEIEIEVQLEFVNEPEPATTS